MLALFFFDAFCTPRCKSTSNNDVDWWSVFKVPSLSDKIPNHVTGLGFFYNDDNIRLHESTSDLGSKNGNPVYYSLQQMYENNNTIGYLLTSDQPPHRDNNPSDSYAHKKGVLVYDKTGGFYIEHSVPRFPNDPKITLNYEFPATGTTYGQSMLCVNLKPADIETWAQGMLLEKGFVYSENTPSFAETAFPSLIKVVNKKWVTQPQTKVSTINVGKHIFRLFSKTSGWGKDLYHDFVAPTLKQDTWSETWSRGVGTFDSNCTGKYKALNVVDVNFQGVKWKRTNDHSKWALAGSNVCIGGINRQKKQLERGGGTWCKADDSFATTMRGVVVSTQPCP